MQEKGLPWSYIIPVVVIIIVITALFVYSYTLPKTSALSGPFGAYPFQCIGAEGTVMHIHPYLRIVINGQNITVPAAIGIVNPQNESVTVSGTQQEKVAVSGSCFEPMHTHDASGIIHIESPDSTTQYTLGDFFQIWNSTYGSISINGTSRPIVFNSTDIMGFQADATHKVVLLVDGIPSTGYGSLTLNTLAYCSAASVTPPCYPTAEGDPAYPGGYPYGTGHTLEIEYVTNSTG